MALSSILKGGQPSGVQTAACFAGVTWLAQSLLQGRVLSSDPLLSLALSALFGGLWLAASWPRASPKQGRFALAVVVVSFIAGVGVPVLVTYLRLGATR